MENIITGTNIGKTFDENVEVLKNVNFNIEKGDIYGLVGRSGAGKSTPHQKGLRLVPPKLVMYTKQIVM